MAQTIQLKRSSVAGNLPTSSDLALGEIAINTADGAVYIKKGNNDIVAVADNDILHIDTTNTRIGIGTTTPAKALQVKTDTNGDGVNIQRNSTTADHYGQLSFSVSTNDSYTTPNVWIRGVRGSSYTNNFMTFGTGGNTGTEAMRIDSSQRVGIGTTSPSQIFTVENNSGIFRINTSTSTYPRIEIGSTSGTTAAIINRTTSTQNIIFGETSDSGNYAFRGGNVGIGTTSPGVHLDIESSTNNAQIELTATDGTDQSYGIFGATGNNSNGAGFYIQDKTASGSPVRLKIDSSGNVGIGTTSPDTKLDITTAGVQGILMNQDTSNASVSSRLLFKDSTRTSAIFNVNGNLEVRTGATIGSTSGTQRLAIKGDGTITFNNAYTFPAADGSANQVLQTDGSGNLSFATVSGGGSSNSITDADGDTKIQVEETTDDDIIRFDTGGTERAVISSNGLNVKSGAIRIAGTDVISSGRNLVNIGTITSGKIEGTTADANGHILKTDSSTASASDVVLQLRNSSSDYNLKFQPRLPAGNMHAGVNADDFGIFTSNSKGISIGNNDKSLVVIHPTDGIEFHTNNTNRFNITTAGNLQLNGTTVIDASRNLTNIGTISSGTITTSGNIDLNGGNIIDVEQFVGIGSSGWLDFNMDTDSVYPQSTTDNQTVLGSVTHMNFVGDSNANGTGGIFNFGYGVSHTDSGTFTRTATLNRSGDLDIIGQLTIGSGEKIVNAGSMTIDVVGGITLDADGGQVDFKDNGTLKGLFDFTGNNLEIQSRVTDGDLLFRGQDGASFITALTLDMSDAGKAVFNAGATFADDVQIGGTVSGTHALKVYHTDNFEAAKFRTNQAGSLARFTDTTASVEFGVQSGNAVIRTGNTARITINSSGNATFNNNLTVTGDLTVNGTTTTLNTATLDVEDKNITLNKGSGDTSGSANGAGITIQDAVDASNDATILWDATNDEFDFSHGITSVGLVSTGTTTDNSASSIIAKNSSGATLFNARNDGVVLIPNNYLFVNSSQGAYITGSLRARGGITNDSGNNLSINSSGGTVEFNNTNLNNITNIRLKGHLLIDSGGFVPQDAEGQEFKYYLVSQGTDQNYKKVADVTISTGSYKSLALRVVLESQSGNFGNVVAVDKTEYVCKFHRSDATLNSVDSAEISGQDPTFHNLRIVKTATGVYELQVRQNANYKDAILKLEVLSTNGGTFTVTDGDVNGSTSGTITTPNSSESASTYSFNKVDTPFLNIQNTIKVNSTQILDSARNLSNIGTISATGFSTNGTTGTFSNTTGSFPLVTSTAYDYVAKFESTDAAAFIILEDNSSTNNGNRVGVSGDTMEFYTAGSKALSLSSGNAATFEGTITASGDITSADRIISKEASGGFYKLHTDGTFRAAFYDDNSNTAIYADGDGSNPFITFSGGATHTTDIDGILNLSNTNASLRIGGTEVISTGRNIANVGSISASSLSTSGDIISSQFILSKVYGFANTGSSSDQYIKFGTISGLAQDGRSLTLRISSNSGYNASSSQNQDTIVRFKTSNNNSNNSGFYGDCQIYRFGEKSNAPEDVIVKQVSTTEFEFYGKFANFTGAGSFYVVEHRFGTWTHDGTNTGSTAPSGTTITATARQIFVSGTNNGGASLSAADITSSGNVNLTSGSLQIGGTTVIESSRNLNNIGDITSTGNALITGSGSSGNAFRVNRGSDGSQAIRIENSGEVVVANNYLYASHTGTAFYVQGGAVFRGGISNDTSGQPVTFNDDIQVNGSLTSTGSLTSSGRGTFTADQTSTNGTINLLASTNGNGAGIAFSDNGTPSTTSNQRGHLTFYHGDSQSFGSGASFRFETSESTLSVLVDGKLLVKDGILMKPSSGTGAGTQILDSSRNLTNINRITTADGINDAGSAGSSTIFNESGSTADFRIESDSNTHMFFLDGGNNAIGINRSNPSAPLDVDGGTLGGTSGDETIAAKIRAGRQNLVFKDTRTATGTDWSNATFKMIAQIDATDHQSIDFVNDSSFNEHIDLRTGNQVFNTRFHQNGRVGIGTTDPFSKLSINSNGAPATSGNVATTGLTIHNGTGGTAIQMGTNDSAYSYIQSTYVNAANNKRELRFILGNTTALTLDTSTNANFANAIQMGGTQIIDSSRNMSNISSLYVRSGYATNYADSSAWVKDTDGFSSQTGYYGGNFSSNGSAAEQSMDYGTAPDGTQALIWTATADTSNNADGGWNKDITGLRDDTTYMSVVYVRRNGTSTTGNFYHGLHGSHTLNLDGSANTNPYFTTSNISDLPQDVWCVSIGFIRANNNSSTAQDSVGGLYRTDTGERIRDYTTFKMKDGSTTQRHRTYLYYSTSGNSSLSWFKPGFYEVNGAEPTVRDLVNPGMNQGTTFNGNVNMGEQGSGTVRKLHFMNAHDKQKIGLYGPAGTGAEWIGTSAATLELSGASINLNGGSGSGTPNLKHGGTTIMDTSRNLTNIGTVSCGAITGSGNASFEGQLLGRGPRSSQRGELHINGLGASDVAEIFFGHGDGYTEGNIRWGISDRASGDDKLVFYKGPYHGGFTEVMHIHAGDNSISVNNFINTTAYRVSGTTVIDSSRNLTNIGTSISSAAGCVFGHGFVSGSRGFNFESGNTTVATIRFDSDTMRFWSGGAGGGNEKIRINDDANNSGRTEFFDGVHIKSGVSSDTIDESNYNLKVQGAGGNGMTFGTKSSSPYTSYIQSAYVEDTSVAQYNLALNPIGGNVGIGTDSPSVKLDVAGAITSSGTITSSGQFTSASGDASFRRAGSTTARIRIESGTTTSDQAFHVGGLFTAAGGAGTGTHTHAKFGGTSGRELQLRTRSDIAGGQHSGCAEIFSADTEGDGGEIALTNNGGVRLFIDGDGKVGIGDTSPAQRLHVVSGSANIVARFESTDTAAIIQIKDSTGTAAIESRNDFRFKVSTSTEQMRLTTAGALHVEGDVTAFSTTVSDERLKDDVVSIDSALDKVMKLRGVEYIWNKGSRQGQKDLGVIAQEVEKVLPEIVKDTEMVLLDEEIYKTVDYEKLTAVLIEAVKEQQEEIEKLKEHSHPAKDMSEMKGYEELVARIEKMEKNYGNN